MDDFKTMKQTLDPEYCSAEENRWEVKGRDFDNGENIRLLISLNITAKAPFVQVLDIKGAPPLMVVVVRADTKITAMGTMDEAKEQIQKAHAKPSVASKLTEGVGSLARRLTH